MTVRYGRYNVLEAAELSAARSLQVERAASAHGVPVVNPQARATVNGSVAT